MKADQFHCRRYGSINAIPCVNECIVEGSVCSELRIKYVKSGDWIE